MDHTVLNLFHWFELTLFRVRSHIRGLSEALSTVLVGTLVGFKAGVVVEVCLQVVLLGERLGTYGTGERFDT